MKWITSFVGCIYHHPSYKPHMFWPGKKQHMWMVGPTMFFFEIGPTMI